MSRLPGSGSLLLSRTSDWQTPVSERSRSHSSLVDAVISDEMQSCSLWHVRASCCQVGCTNRQKRWSVEFPFCAPRACTVAALQPDVNFCAFPGAGLLLSDPARAAFLLAQSWENPLGTTFPWP